LILRYMPADHEYRWYPVFNYWAPLICFYRSNTIYLSLSLSLALSVCLSICLSLYTHSQHCVLIEDYESRLFELFDHVPNIVLLIPRGHWSMLNPIVNIKLFRICI
jgi:hypothetical protein